ncbi:coiled-coil domain-containing protein [Actinoalloteichus hymeniacidonis]|uniref:DivIVA protein n=1 Tax=Actinoalloteichus hymeniacidonis TaxID=340345 RepID=A0AAC9MXG7_9PSEU|nr:hypothetical protein [Actinoalloteichus hymeniacidonis]AOS62309.1 hypothetical protein TL08_07455 [Actinoalloteichus hymeniacidonis]MBB5909664.1 cell division septum initiation protein DivIVA [Actinoalloteichus hymeniacidonis]
MGLADDRDLLPLGSGFETVRRGGYNRAQVDEHLERLDTDLRILAADRNAALSQATDLARQLEATRAEVEALHSQVERLNQPPTSLEGMSERLQRMLRLAQEEANEIRSRAETDVADIKARSEAEITELRNHYDRLIAENENRRQEMESEHRELLDKGRRDTERALAEGQAEATRLVTEADRARKAADEESEARRIKVDEDFEIAMSARRTDAMRALAEQEAHSKAEAERRVREATHEANRRLQEATAESHRRVREATEESNRRVSKAQNQVETLRKHRARLAEQVRTINGLLADSLPLIQRFEEEGDAPWPHFAPPAPPNNPAPVQNPQQSGPTPSGHPGQQAPAAASAPAAPSAAAPASPANPPAPGFDPPTQQLRLPEKPLGRSADNDAEDANPGGHTTMLARPTPPAESTEVLRTDGGDASTETELSDSAAVTEPEATSTPAPEITLRWSESAANGTVIAQPVGADATLVADPAEVAAVGESAEEKPAGTAGAFAPNQDEQVTATLPRPGHTPS